MNNYELNIPDFSLPDINNETMKNLFEDGKSPYELLQEQSKYLKDTVPTLEEMTKNSKEQAESAKSIATSAEKQAISSELIAKSAEKQAISSELIAKSAEKQALLAEKKAENAEKNSASANIRANISIVVAILTMLINFLANSDKIVYTVKIVLSYLNILN